MLLFDVTTCGQGPVRGTPSWNPYLYTILNWETFFPHIFPQNTKCLSLQEAVLMIEISVLVLLLLKVLLFVFLSKSLLCRPHLKNERTRGYIVSDIFIVPCKAYFSWQRRQTPIPLFFYLFHVKCQLLLSAKRAVADCSGPRGIS